MNLLFSNEHFVVVDKPALVLTTPSREGGADPRECLGLQLQKELGQQIFPVHRLDFEVSGLVMFALAAKSHAAANGWFEHRAVFKTYQALTQAQSFDHIPASVLNSREALELRDGARFHWRCHLLRGKRRAYEHEAGKPCETEAVFLGALGTSLRWELHPLTGRPHQLRFELSRHGFPILGDELYGARLEFDRPGIALRAVRMDFSGVPASRRFGLPEALVGPGFW